MNRLVYNRLLVVAFTGCVFFVTGFVAVTYNSLKKTTQISNENQTTLVVLKHLEIAQNSILYFDDEYQRYMLTGDTVYYNHATNEADRYFTAIAALNPVTVTNTHEQNDLTSYKQLSAARINDGLGKMAAYRAASKLLEPENKARAEDPYVLDSLKALSERIETYERANLALYDKQKLESAAMAFRFVLAFAVIAVVCFGGFSIAIKKKYR